MSGERAVLTNEWGKTCSCKLVGKDLFLQTRGEIGMMENAGSKAYSLQAKPPLGLKLDKVGIMRQINETGMRIATP